MVYQVEFTQIHCTFGTTLGPPGSETVILNTPLITAGAANMVTCVKYYEDGINFITPDPRLSTEMREMGLRWLPIVTFPIHEW